MTMLTGAVAVSVTTQLAVRLCIICTASIMLTGGCAVRDQGGTVTLVIQDAKTGQPLNGCLLVTVLDKTETYVGSIMGGESSAYKASDGQVRRVDSGYVLRQPAYITPVIPLGLLWVTNEGDYVHYLYREGYRVRFFADVGQQAKTKAPLVVSLEREEPGEMKSDREVVDTAMDAIDNLIPAMPQSQPLRAEIIRLVREQVKRVLQSSKDHGILSIAKWDLALIEQKFGHSDK